MSLCEYLPDLHLFCELYVNKPHYVPDENIKKTLTKIIRCEPWATTNNVKWTFPDYLPNEISHVRFCNDFHETVEIEFCVSKFFVNGNTEEDFEQFLDFEVVTLEESLSSAETLPGGDDEDSTTSSHNWMLPCEAFADLWENLYYEAGTKADLLRYALTCLQLGRFGVNPNIILCNRLILLHGPPGTGKTTICRALAQKLSIRMAKVYPRAQLVEVNCHSLFSKWFSQSGKLVSKMFSVIRQYAEDPEMLVIVLIDEVESLTAARQAAMNGNEPSDTIRVVNAVLNQLDILRFRGNVLILATSNLTEAIDTAFLDRADLIKYIGLPGRGERVHIMMSCLTELLEADIITIRKPRDPKEECMVMCIDESCLDRAAEITDGLSGRALRKLPIIALSLLGCGIRKLIPHLDFIKKMEEAATTMKKGRLPIGSLQS